MIVGDIGERGDRRMRGYVTRDNNTRCGADDTALSITHWA